MESELDLDVLDYELCPDDPGFARCEFCRTKIFVGKNKTDLARHAQRCDFR